MRKTVLLADDHAVIRQGLRAIIEDLDPDLEVIGEAGDGREFLDLAAEKPADIYVVDISMPVLNGVEAMIRLLKTEAGAKVIILSMYKDKILVEKAVKNGARGYVLKESAGEELVKAIEEVYKGQYYFSPAISGHLVHGFLYGRNGGGNETLESTLTDRQREILKLICDGYTEKDIGKELNISYHTVHVHKNNIMKALDIHSKAELIKYAIKNQIVQV
ncbi:MAG: response regulator [Spirochaetes bacterium]|jgi:two-component system response regulator NreC|nr:response regulator [Spirochaetota bacterium]